MSKYDDLVSKYNDLIESHKPVVQNTVCENCNNCSWCSDCSYCDNCEKCYHCTACNKCVDCDDCNYCHYCTDCESCECCLFCVGLRVQNNNPEMTLGELEETPYNKMLDINKYYVLNEQVSKEQFEETLEIIKSNKIYE